MATVRWFHKVHEVSTILPPDVSTREIFYSLCLKDFSVECIDGLATVLSPCDFDKFQNESAQRFSSLEPYICRRQIDNDDIKKFDITKIKGYWSQGVLRTMYATSETSMKLRLKTTHGIPSINQDHIPKKKKQRLNAESINSRDETKSHVLTVVPKTEKLENKLQHQLAKGNFVEVLSQDSGMRGCWFRCLILKKHCDKVKVQYQDVQDAENNGKLEEWILASRVASPDKLGIRLPGRFMVRPSPPSDANFSSRLDIGAIVDAWKHNGWWEGIIIAKVSEDKFLIHFPGEHQVSTFNLSDLRLSHDWVDNKWHAMKERPHLARLLSDETDVPKVTRGLGGLHWNGKRKRLNKPVKFSSNKRIKLEEYNIVRNLLAPGSLTGVESDNCRVEEQKPLLASSSALCF